MPKPRRRADGSHEAFPDRPGSVEPRHDHLTGAPLVVNSGRLATSLADQYAPELKFSMSEVEKARSAFWRAAETAARSRLGFLRANPQRNSPVRRVSLEEYLKGK